MGHESVMQALKEEFGGSAEVFEKMWVGVFT